MGVGITATLRHVRLVFVTFTAGVLQLARDSFVFFEALIVRCNAI